MLQTLFRNPILRSRTVSMHHKDRQSGKMMIIFRGVQKISKADVKMLNFAILK